MRDRRARTSLEFRGQFTYFGIPGTVYLFRSGIEYGVPRFPRFLPQIPAHDEYERQVGKSAAALLLESRIGEQFDAIVTGGAARGTWVRIVHPPIEGRLEHGFEGADVGQKLRVRLVHTDVERGYIDFARVG